jgi:hypothetical protein
MDIFEKFSGQAIPIYNAMMKSCTQVTAIPLPASVNHLYLRLITSFYIELGSLARGWGMYYSGS